MKKALLYSLGFSLIAFVVFFKPISIYVLESSLSVLLETPVKIIDFKLLSLDLYASIKDKENIAHVKINTLFPFQADLTYEGNIDAFKVYHPLKAPSTLYGSVSYKDHLDINAELFTMDSKTRVNVIEKPNDWFVDVNVSALDLNLLQKENNISIDMQGKVDILVNFHTGKDSMIELRSKYVEVLKQDYNDIRIQVKEVKEHIEAFALFSAPNIDYKGIWFNYDEKTKRFDAKVNLRLKTADNDILMTLEGEHNDTKLSADIFTKIAKSEINIRNIIYDLNSSETSANVDIKLKQIQRHVCMLKEIGLALQGDFNASAKLLYKNEDLEVQGETKSLGGYLSLVYDKGFQWEAKGLELKKIAHILKLKQDLKASFDTRGTFENDKLSAFLTTSSLHINKTEIKDINVSSKGDLNNLSIHASAYTQYAELKDMNLSIKDYKYVKARATLTSAYTRDSIVVDVNASYIDSTVNVDLESKSQEFSLIIPALKYKKDRLTANYQLIVESKLSTLKDTITVDGNFAYDKSFTFNAQTKHFGKNISLNLKNEKIKLYTRNLRLENLFLQLGQAPYAKGKIDFDVYGDSKKLNFSLNSKLFTLNEKETGIDGNLSLHVKGMLNKEEVYIWPELKNRSIETSKGLVFFDFNKKKLNVKLPLLLHKKKDKLNLVLDSSIDFQAETKGYLHFVHKDDTIGLSKLIYNKEGLHSDLRLSINDLYVYAPMLEQELHGSFHMRGPVNYLHKKADINVSTQSLGGHLNITLKDKELKVHLKELLAVKIGSLLKGNGNSQSGTLNAEVKYNLENKSGLVELSAQDVEVKGVDIDKSLKEVKDILGLNIFAMGNSLIKNRFSTKEDENLSTKVKEMKFDVEITPTLIVSKDIALSTENTRVAVDMNLKRNGDIKDFEVAILDYQGCSILRQKLQGNIKEPTLVLSKGTAVVILGQAPKEILKTGGRLVSAGASLLDSTASFIWKKGLRQDSNVTLVEDSFSKGANIFSSGKEMIVRGKCEPFYTGTVSHPH